MYPKQGPQRPKDGMTDTRTWQYLLEPSMSLDKFTKNILSQKLIKRKSIHIAYK